MDGPNSHCFRTSPSESGDGSVEGGIKLKSSLKNNVCMDYSHNRLTEFPSSEVINCSYIQFLYLQDNVIEKLPTHFFDNFPALRHLDLRQNCLTELPTSIANHSNLEVLLLQDNQLTALPCELGQVPRLRKLQFSGNPLIWPPEKILVGGLTSILSFLRTAFMQQLSKNSADAIPEANNNENEDVVQNNSENYEISSQSLAYQRSDLEDLASQSLPLIYGKMKRPSRKESKNYERLLQSGQELIILRGSPKQLKSRDSTHTCSSKNLETSHYQSFSSPDNAQAVMNGQTFPLGYKKRSSGLSTTKVYKTLMQQIWLNQLKCIRQSQDHDLQRQKTWEALRQWRQEAKSLQRSRSQQSWSGLHAPFDLDSDYLEMVNRAGLQKGKNESLEKKGHSKPKTSCMGDLGLQEKIRQILQSFEELKSNPTISHSNSNDVHPSTRLKLLADEMQKIRKLQKSVQALRLST